MKTKTILFALLAMLPALAFCQETKTVSLLADTTTGIYKFVEVTVYDDGDLTDTVNVRYFPPGGLTEAQVSGYLFSQARAQKERADDLTNLRREAVQGFEFWAATIDTLFGANTYQATINAQVQQAIQGTWTLVLKGQDREVFTCTVSGTAITSGEETGTLTVTAEGEAELVWDKKKVSLTLNRSGKWRGKRGATNYILQR